MKKILFVCGDPPHPIHEKIGRNLGADFYYLESGSGFFKKLKKFIYLPGDYDFYLSEGLFGYLFLARILRKISKKSKTINLFSDPRLHQIVAGKKFDFYKGSFVKYPFFRRSFQVRAILNLDGALCIGEYQRDLLRKISPNINAVVIPPFVERGEFFRSKVSSLRKDNILFIGNGPDYYYKGLDFLIDVFGKVSCGQNKLYVVGSSWEKFKKYNKIPKGVVFLGRKNTKELLKIMDEVSLYCHFGRGEAVGISILEAMLKGIPCFVSTETGAKEYVTKAQKDFVMDMKDKDAVVLFIKNYFKKSLKERKKIGDKFKKSVLDLTEENSFKKLNILKKELFY